jgi:hypothetical protein
VSGYRASIAKARHRIDGISMHFGQTAALTSNYFVIDVGQI